MTIPREFTISDPAGLDASTRALERQAQAMRALALRGIFDATVRRLAAVLDSRPGRTEYAAPGKTPAHP